MRCVASPVRTSPASSGASRTRRRCDIVAGWPQAFDARRALQLGFRAESDFDEIIRVYIDDELGALPSVETAP